MATFSSTKFNAARYQASRPTTPPELLQAVYDYHSKNGGAWQKCLDLGCGTGQTSRLLAERFEHVVGVDASPTMINIAKQVPADAEGTAPSGKIEYAISAAEELSFVKDASIDMVTSSQAAHWFKYDKLWPELGRILKANGTIAFWNYGHMRLPKHLHLSQNIIQLADGPEGTGFQGCYEEPGYSISDSLLEAVPSPGPPFSPSSTRRIKFSGGYVSPKNIPEYLPEGERPEIRPALLRRRWTWEQLEGHFRTWSGYHAYELKHPEDKEMEGGDVVSRMVTKLKAAVLEDGGDKDELDVEWSIGLLLATKAK